MNYRARRMWRILGHMRFFAVALFLGACALGCGIAWAQTASSTSVAPAAIFVKHQLLTPRNVDLVYPLDESAAGTARKSTNGSEFSAMRNHKVAEV